MTSRKQREAARRNIRKAQRAWNRMSSRQRAMRAPQGRGRAKPGAKGEGSYYHVRVRSKRGFSSFRTQDVGRPGHAQRVAGHRPGGSWSTVKWLIAKDDAHVSGGKLVADTASAKKVLDRLGSTPRHEKGDLFKAKSRRNVPEKEKPTAAQRRARRENLKKAFAAKIR